jgi:hypothetical protein
LLQWRRLPIVFVRPFDALWVVAGLRAFALERRIIAADW